MPGWCLHLGDGNVWEVLGECLGQKMRAVPCEGCEDCVVWGQGKPRAVPLAGMAGGRQTSRTAAPSISINQLGL